MESLSDLFTSVAGAPALAGLLMTAVIIFLASDWRLSLTALLVQYILVGLALTRQIQIEVALVKILAGVLAVFILYLTARRVQGEHTLQPSAETGERFPGLSTQWRAGPLGLPLRLLSVVLVALALVQLFGDFQLPLVSQGVAFLALWLGGMGLLGLVLSGDPMRVAPAALTLLAGFDLVYGGLEQSLAIAGLWSAVTLLASLAFSYLVIVHGMSQVEPTQEEAEL